METKSTVQIRWVALAAIAPVLFGSNYWVIKSFMPAGAPLWGSALRALPAGLLLLLIVRRLPRGSWWWKSLVLGTLNMGVFFLLIYVAAQLLPSSVASSIGALGPIVMALLAWGLVRERPTLRVFIAAAIGLAGVLLIVGMSSEAINPWGLAASAATMLLLSVGSVLSKRWDDGTPVLATTSWQLLAGGIELVVIALIFEGAPPAYEGAALLAVGYQAIISTALAYVIYFTGLRHLQASTVGMLNLLNPVTGVLLGVLLASESLAAAQVLGIALVLGSIAIGGRKGRKAAGRQAPTAAGAREAAPEDPAAPGRVPVSTQA